MLFPIFVIVASATMIWLTVCSAQNAARIKRLEDQGRVNRLEQSLDLQRYGLEL